MLDENVEKAKEDPFTKKDMGRDRDVTLCRVTVASRRKAPCRSKIYGKWRYREGELPIFMLLC